jgi:hypothetical protein
MREAWLRMAGGEMRYAKWVLAVAYAGLAALAGWLFYTRYWAHRDCIGDADSSCVTADGANLIEGGMVWGVFAAVFLLLAASSALRRS